MMRCLLFSILSNLWCHDTIIAYVPMLSVHSAQCIALDIRWWIECIPALYLLWNWCWYFQTILYFQSKNQGRKLHFLKKYKIFVFFKGRLMKTVLNRSCRIHDHKAATLVIVVSRHWGYRVSLYSTKNWITKSFPSNWLGIYPGPKKGTCRN